MSHLRGVISLIIISQLLSTLWGDGLSQGYGTPASDSQIISALTPKETVLLKGEAEHWRSRAMSWYHSDDQKSRRRQMREMSRPLKRSCYYCHTRSFKGYIEERYLIGLQMMAISAEQEVSCADCHLGKRGLSAMGATSLIQWRYAVEKGLDCSDCHLPKQRFKKLTAQGLSSREALVAWVIEQRSSLQLPSSFIEEYLNRLKAKKTVTPIKDHSVSSIDSSVPTKGDVTPSGPKTE